MEWSLHSELLLALKANALPSRDTLASISTVAVQAQFCIDDRECSLRRYLEEIDSAIETFGAAGFFGIDFFYQGLDDAYPVAQCPIVITPKHLIEESGGKPEQDNKSKAEEWTNMHFTAHSMFRVVGRRTLTRDLFLDRRAFLHSYLAETDPEGNIIIGILSAIFPVCGGINLEYFFSRIDNSVYGSGTKPRHNVIGLLGVANGVEGELQTGLSRRGFIACPRE